MFKKKKLYKITYRVLNTYTTIISAKDEYQAINKLHRMIRRTYTYPATIISFEEFNVGRG